MLGKFPAVMFSFAPEFASMVVFAGMDYSGEPEVQRLKENKYIMDNRWAKKAVEALKPPEGPACV